MSKQSTFANKPKKAGFTPPSPTRIIVALVLLVAAFINLFDLDFSWVPQWAISWPVILIIIGLYRLVQEKRADVWGLILTFVGFRYLLRDLDPATFSGIEVWPLILIAVALYLLFGGRDGNHKRFMKPMPPSIPPTPAGSPNPPSTPNGPIDSVPQTPDTSLKVVDALPNAPTPPQPANHNEKIENQPYAGAEKLQANLLFAGTKKRVLTQNFKGGEVNCFLGGAEIDLRESNIEGKVVLEVNVFAGGVELRLPIGWQLVNETTPILGGVDDSRMNYPANPDAPVKLLVLRGVIFMGGLEITN